jgi:hypothetical protein
MAGVAKYSVEIKPSAGKELDALNNILFVRIDRKILALSENPRPSGCKKLRGYKDQWRLGTFPIHWRPEIPTRQGRRYEFLVLPTRPWYLGLSQTHDMRVQSSQEVG